MDDNSLQGVREIDVRDAIALFILRLEELLNSNTVRSTITNNNQGGIVQDEQQTTQTGYTRSRSSGIYRPTGQLSSAVNLAREENP
jgi:hypothetical protein